MTNSRLLGLRATQLLLILTSSGGQLLNAIGIRQTTFHIEFSMAIRADRNRIA
jgi:hypothetical protein